MDENELVRIKEFLNELDIEINSISKSRLQQLIKLDDAIQMRFKEIERTKKFLEKTEINISDISSEADISRKTFYNNDLLKKYIEKYLPTYIEKHSSIIANHKNYKNDNELRKLQNQNSILEKEVRDLVNRDIDIELIRLKNADLINEIKNLQKNISILEVEYEKIKAELAEAKAKLFS